MVLLSLQNIFQAIVSGPSRRLATQYRLIYPVKSVVMLRFSKMFSETAKTSLCK